MSRPANYDVVIIGAGPAGSTLGTLLGRAGVSTLLVDKARFPRVKPCGGMLSAKSVSHITEVFGWSRVEPLCRTVSDGWWMFYRGDPVSEISDAAPLYCVERAELDALLLSFAEESGCAVEQGARAVGIDRSPPAVRFASGRVVRCSILVGADGVQSLVRRVLRGGRIPAQGMGFGVVADVPLDDLKQSDPWGPIERPEIYFGLSPWSYGWVFPKGSNASVGVGGLLAKTGNLRKLMESFVAERCVPGALDRLRLMGHGIPLGNFERSPGLGNILVLGDAAGMAEPLTGEGIAFALASSRAAAPAVIEALNRGRPWLAGRLYNEACRQEIIPHLRRACLARWAFFPERVMRFVVCSLRRDPVRARLYADVVAGKLSYPAYFRRIIGRALLRRLGLLRIGSKPVSG